jgi:O-methyltransferase involved in polyketide biosynthesis
MSGDHNAHQKPKSYLESTGLMGKLEADDAQTWAAVATIINRQKVAQWMIDRGYATGRGDTIEDLLKELDWQIEERIKNARGK